MNSKSSNSHFSDFTPSPSEAQNQFTYDKGSGFANLQTYDQCILKSVIFYPSAVRLQKHRFLVFKKMLFPARRIFAYLNYAIIPTGKKIKSVPVPCSDKKRNAKKPYNSTSLPSIPKIFFLEVLYISPKLRKKI